MKEINKVLVKTAEILRRLAQENEDLKNKLAEYEKESKARSIAKVMEEKNLEPDLDFDGKVEKLMKESNIDDIERLVKMSAPQYPFGIPGGQNSASETLEQFLLGGK